MQNMAVDSHCFSVSCPWQIAVVWGRFALTVSLMGVLLAAVLIYIRRNRQATRLHKQNQASRLLSTISVDRRTSFLEESSLLKGSQKELLRRLP